MDFSLVIPAFIAGILTFLAPCTLPLVPGYLGFISGVSVEDRNNPERRKSAKARTFMNGLFYVVGFSVVFIVLGTLVGLGGAALVKYRVLLGRIGGVFIILFGLYMMGALKLKLFSFLNREHRFGAGKFLKPGRPTSSLLFGATFAFGWTPCIGPVLGSVLTLAASTATVGQGTVLLSVFSLGLAVPFLAIAASVDRASQHLERIYKYLKPISVIGGVFLVFLGVLLLTDTLTLWTGYAFRIFNFLGYDRLLQQL